MDLTITLTRYKEPNWLFHESLLALSRQENITASILVLDQFYNQETKEYKEWLQSDHYESLGICKSVTYERLRKVIEGYTTPKGKEIAGLAGNLSYYKIVK